jgi:hypothetical protein
MLAAQRLKPVIATILTLGAFSCHQPQHYHLKDLVALEAIDSIVIHNSAGDYQLKPAELRHVKTVLGAMHYRPEGSLKMGSIGLSVYAGGQEHYLSGRTHGKYLEVPKGLVSKHNELLPIGEAYNELLFEFDEPLNLDNYRKHE